MNDHDLTHIGDHYGLGHDARRPFGITRADRRQGLHLIGQSGTGKSALMLRMLCQDIMAGEGVTLIDPHGLTAQKLLDHIPPGRVKDVCYFNVADTVRPVPFNILDARLPPGKQHLVVSAVVAAFCGIWNLTPERAPRLLNILKFGVAALLETPDATLLSLERLLTDEAYRVRVVTRHSNPAVRRFWLEWTCPLGVEGLLTNPSTPQEGRMAEKRTRRRFTAEFKVQAVRRLLDGGKGLTEVATELGLSPGQLSGWRNEHLAAGSAEVLAARKAEQAELQRLKRENKRLEEEVEILKKATAFFARGIA
jgi:transposase-like protein